MIAAIRAHGSPRWKYEAYVDTADTVAQSRDDWQSQPNSWTYPKSAKSSLDRATGPINISAGSSNCMRIGRTILTFLVALSLVMLSIAGAFAVPSDEPTVSDAAVASAHDCCDHESMPADHVMKDCQASADCIAKCFNFYAVVFSGMAIPSPIGGMESRFVSNPFYSQTATPPYRPPRV